MNCPSRTDDSWLKPDWNQNPPVFAADLTTREDMNGIANARELGDADRRKSGVAFLKPYTSDCTLQKDPINSGALLGIGAKGPPGLCTNPSYFNSFKKQLPPTDKLRSWVWWLLSVFVVSMIISPGHTLWPTKTDTNYSHHEIKDDLIFESPSHLTKRASCTTGNGGAKYNLGFHIMSLFIILFVSTSACAFPVLVIRFPRLRIPHAFLFSAKHFGTGVLIATSFVHLLPTAFISLGNPCLSSFWTSDYPAMPGAIALAAVFFVTFIEMVFSPNQHTCGGDQRGMNAVSRTRGGQRTLSTSTRRQQDNETRSPDNPDPRTEFRDLGVLRGRAASISRTLSRMGEQNQRLDEIEHESRAVHDVEPKRDNESEMEEEDQNHARTVDNNEVHLENHALSLTPEQTHKKAIMQLFLLEMGILFHSVFIGMSLSVSIGGEAVILLIAIIFHQTFEGLALGARIADIKWKDKAIQPWMMALAYGCTTPIGQAIGIATHSLYSPDSEVGLLVVGIMNAISSGLLIFASLVELLSEDLLSDESWTILRGKRRVYACVLVFMGAFLMSLIGAWA